MHTTLFLISSALAALAAGQVFKFPLENGFANITNATLKAIEYQAGGPLPPPGPLMKLSAQAAQALEALAFNEIFEVAFFSQLLNNITESDSANSCLGPGYELTEDRDLIIAAVNSSIAQEEIHFLNANMGLKASGIQIEPCEYDFPVNSFKEAMAIATNFADMLIGAVPTIVTDFGTAPPMITLFSAILGQEGEQEGYFRYLNNNVPNENAFLTSTTLSLLYNHIVQNYVVPGTCPQNLGLPLYERLLALESPPPANTTISFSTTQQDVASSKYYVAYMSGQIYLVVKAIKNIQSEGNVTTFEVSFPFDAGFSRGLTVAALVNKPGPFTNVSQVANVTVAGPALIQVDYD